MGVPISFSNQLIHKRRERKSGIFHNRINDDLHVELPWGAELYYLEPASLKQAPWLRSHERQGQNLDDFPHVKRWFEAINARPAVQRGLQVLSENQRKKPGFDDKEREVLFGKTQYQRS